MRPHFRFEDLDIWQLSKSMAVEFHRLADVLEHKRYYKYAEQLRTAGLSVPRGYPETASSPATLRRRKEEFGRFAPKLQSFAPATRGRGARQRGFGIASNNIAEGSGSLHVKEFKQFLNVARRSLFENASMLLVFEAMGLWERGQTDSLLEQCDKLSRMITNYSRAIK